MSKQVAILLQSDNFTPPQRTPWGGTRIIAHYKNRLIPQDHPLRTQAVGEAWEVSYGPEFPSKLQNENSTFAQWLAAHPEALGEEAKRGDGATALLVKFLDAKTPLSIQVHPHDNDRQLKHDESGKPESWYVLDHEEGAGIYLGFKRGVKSADVRRCLEAKGALDQLMHFIPVQRGDFLLLEAGIPHAIGGGVTLLEPQRVLPGKRGITYRFWDWNRLYDDSGQSSPTGKARELHVEASLGVTRWSQSDDPNWPAEIHHRSTLSASDQSARVEQLCGPEGSAKLKSSTLRAFVLGGTGKLIVPYGASLQGITVVEGELMISMQNEALRMVQGQSGVLAASPEFYVVELKHCLAVLSSIVA